MLSIIMQSVNMVCHYAACHFTECRHNKLLCGMSVGCYAKCQCTECHYAELVLIC
jgi:hypothetical protein